MQLQHEFGNSRRVQTIEKTYEQKVVVDSGSKYHTHRRDVDIVLEEGQGDDIEEIWVETKSLIGKSAKSVTRWNVVKGDPPKPNSTTSSHREFALDCVGNKIQEGNETSLNS